MTRSIKRGSVFAVAVVMFVASAAQAALLVVTINPGDNIQAVVDAHLPGTTYQLAAGMFRMQSVVPKTGDTFKGTLGAGGVRLTIMSGARLLTSFVPEGSYLVAVNQTQEGQVHGECLPAFPRCNYPEDLFIDDVAFVHVDALARVDVGTYFFDYAADKIYLSNCNNLAGHRVETGVTRVAFSGTATGVTIQDMVIEKYASPHQMGAIGDQFGPGALWTVKNVEARWNHGLAIRMETGNHLVNSVIHDNGGMGVGGGGSLLLMENNEVYNNGRGGVDWHWEGGGTKFFQTSQLIVRGNNSHNNLGPGLWTDGDNINALYENNTVTKNEGPGIFHEISLAVTICNNTIKDNGTYVDPGWIWDAGIQISTSSDAVIYGNTIEVNSAKYAHGISYLQQNRGSGTYGPYRTANNFAYNNVVTINGSNARGAAGVVEDYSGNGDIFRSNNLFDLNNYYLPDLSVKYFVWAGAWINWAAWQSYWQDLNGVAHQTR